MAGENISPNMGLPIPGVAITDGPQWAADLDNCLTIVDGHTHTPGSGVQLTPPSLNINSDLPFGGNNATTLRSVRFAAQTAPLALPADIGCLYESGVDLFYNDGLGNQIQLTRSGAVTGTPGSIANLLPPASATFVAGTGTFVWQSAANTPANMDAASYILRDFVMNSPGLTLSPPSGMGADYSITLPSLPAAQAVLTMDVAGNISASPAAFLALMPSGAISAYGGTSQPSGWLFCDGTAVSRTTYANLFAAISTAYGVGDGSTTFNLPDLRGMFQRGTSNGSGNDPDAGSRTATNGGNSGDNVGSTQGDQIQSHSHSANPVGVTINDPGHNHTWNGAIVPQYQLFTSTGTPAIAAGTDIKIIDRTSSTPTAPATTGITANAVTASINAAGGAETRPINVYVNYIIKT